MSPRSANLLTLAGLAALLALVSLTAPRWARVLREPLPVAAPLEDETEPEAGPGDEAASGAGRRISVQLFFEDAERSGLVLEEREVAFSSELAPQIRAVLEELIRGSRAGHLAPLSAETKVIEVFVTARGIAYVDLSKEAALAQVGGSRGELLAVYAVVNSITANFPAVARVQILLDDRPAQTLAGHVDLSRPLPPDMTLLASLLPAPPAPNGQQPTLPATPPRSTPSPVS